MGFAVGLQKAAAAAHAIDGIKDAVLSDLREISGDATVTAATRLDELLPKGKALEALITEQERVFGVDLSDAVLARLFTSGTAEDLARALSTAALSKTASFGADAQRKQRAHQRYLQNRSHHLAASKVYRMQHMSKIRRQARAYRRKVKRKIHRPKKRVGSVGGGFSLIHR